MRKSIYRLVGKLKREETDNETFKAIKSLGSPTTSVKIAKKLKIDKKSVMKRVRRLESQKRVHRKQKKGKDGRYFLIYLGKK